MGCSKIDLIYCDCRRPFQVKGCCCFSLRTGSLILAALSLVWSSLAFIIYCFCALNRDKIEQGIDQALDQNPDMPYSTRSMLEQFRAMLALALTTGKNVFGSKKTNL